MTQYGSDGSFDLILSFETIEHIPFYKQALANLHRLLRPGGELLISSPNRPVTSPLAKRLTDTPANKFHTQEFTPDELLSELREVGFVARPSDLYGQRLRSFHVPFRSAKLRRLQSFALGRPDSRGDAEVSKMNGMVPRYFVIRAGTSRPE